MPIPFKIKKETFFLPIGWGELPFWKIAELKHHSKTPHKLVKFLIDCPHDIDATAAIPLLTWISEPIDLEAFEPSVIIGDLRRKTWGQKLEAVSLLQQDGTIGGIANVVKVYTETDCEQLTLDELVPMYLEITNQLTEILKTEKATLEILPTPEQIRAGISEFEKLGIFSTIDDLAGGDPLKYDAVLQLEYSVVYSKLLKNKISHTFASRYEEVMKTLKK